MRARHQRWPGPGLGYVQKFIMHYEVLLLTDALPSPIPTTTCGAGSGKVRMGEAPAAREEAGERSREGARKEVLMIVSIWRCSSR